MSPGIDSDGFAGLRTERQTHFWRVHTRLGERRGQSCRVLARGGMNTILVEFEDGYRVVTSRNYVRRLRSPRLPQ